MKFEFESKKKKIVKSKGFLMDSFNIYKQLSDILIL